MNRPKFEYDFINELKNSSDSETLTVAWDHNDLDRLDAEFVGDLLIMAKDKYDFEICTVFKFANVTYVSFRKQEYNVMEHLQKALYEN